MDTIIVALIVAAAFAYVVNKFVKMWKGEGGCSCAGGCGGCPESEGACGQDKPLFK